MSNPLRSYGRHGLRRCLETVVAGATLGAVLVRADWPAFRHDAQRSGCTPEALPATLSLRWSHRLSCPPRPAWPRSERMTYDRAVQPVLAGGMIFFGSSGDGVVRALDAATGVERWSHATEGPVRFAPVYGEGHLYVASDDGRLYCLAAGTGELRWTHQGAPNDALALGNERMISRWPARGGPVVVEGTVHYAAGIWPSDGVFVYGVGARDGRTRWMNDTAGTIWMGQPHGGAEAHSGIAPQGYLAATGDHVLVPNGRAVPASLRRADGRFEYFHLQANGQRGGGPVVAADEFVINDGLVFDRRDGQRVADLKRGLVAVLPGGLVQVAGGELVVYEWAERPRTDRRGTVRAQRAPVVARRFAVAQASRAVELVVAGPDAYVGATGAVCRVDLAAGNEVWRAGVDGAAWGLAAAGGMLVVSTDRGVLHGYGTAAGPARGAQPSATSAVPVRARADAEGDSRVGRAAAEVLVRAGVTSGYCVDLGCGDGALALELARRSALHVVAVDASPAAVAAARARLMASGLYGSRVVVLRRDPARSGLPDYVANLIVSGRLLAEGGQGGWWEEARRVQRPYGGVICAGQPGMFRVEVRGTLEGAGSWTHQYADAANTLCSDDALVRGPLGLLWFTDVDQRLVQRHGRPPAPLFLNGVLYVEGIDSLVAVDAYNGHVLWKHPLPGILAAYDGDHLMGASGTGSNFCLSEDSVYVRRDNYCLRLDARTGRRLGRWVAPRGADGAVLPWGFIAWADGVLFGSLANPGHVVTYRYLRGGDLTRQLTESKTLFALDATSGELKWRHEARHSLRHNTIAIGAGAVVLIDRPMTLYDRVRGATPTNEPSGDLVALAAQTGQVLWRQDRDIYGTVAMISARHSKIIMGYQPTRFALASELGGRLTVFDLSTGNRLWERRAQYRSRLMVNDRTLYAEGGAWDLETGQEVAFPLKRSYGCGTLSCARDLVLYRSATLGYFDLLTGSGTEEFGGMRPGCWINTLPVGGLVLVPDATAGCVCSYPNQAWVALQTDGVRAPRIDPHGGTSRAAVTVRLQAGQPDRDQVRYTLDGTPPRADSPLYRQPLVLRQSASLQARSFAPHRPASRIASAAFTIGPDVVPLDPGHWQTADAPGALPASRWILAAEMLEQKANTLVKTARAMSADPAAERPGTMQVYREGYGFANGDLSLEIRSVDNDTVGVAFRYQDAGHYYLWLMDSERSFRAVAVKDGAHYRLLARQPAGYTPGQWHALKILMRGSRITVFFDGQKDMDVQHDRYAAGTVAAYAWGNSGVSFRHWRFKTE
ncbi:MAG: PQQ-binding-like beta-propeller repeat protein [Verrucomicrobia bacterium]|nr:PQQ-binding-like beta-propeller repeat protein [Verrucomicrobiota bacterium]